MARVLSTVVRGRRVDTQFEVLNALSGSSSPERLCLMLPSSGSRYKQWQPLASQIRAQRQILAVGCNLFGVGKSTTPDWIPLDEAGYDLTDQVDAIVAVANEVDARAPVTLIGHSYGGAVAIKVAERLATLSRKVDNVVLYEPNALYMLPEEAEGADQPITRIWKEFLHLAAAGNGPEIGRLVHTFWHGEGSWATLAPEQQARISAVLLRGLPRELTMLVGEARPGASASSTASLRAIDGEKHYLHGTVGTAPLILRLAALLAEEAGFTTHAMAGVDHMGPITAPATVSQAIARCARLS